MCDVTQILGKIEAGDPAAAKDLMPPVYEELRKLAAAKMAQERPDQTLQATALVHEAYIRLVDVDKAQHWDSRRHFFSAAAEAMRRILVEQAAQSWPAKRRGVPAKGVVECGTRVARAGTGPACLERITREAGEAGPPRGGTRQTSFFRGNDERTGRPIARNIGRNSKD